MLAPWRRLPAFLLLLALCVLVPAHAATTYTFNNGKIDGCTRKAKEKEYECDKLPLSNEYDQMVIANDVTVLIKSDVWFGYNQSLTMSGNARLASTGNLSIADIAPANLKVTGGSFGAAGTFSVGNQVHNLKADVDAGKLMLGSGSGLQITGKLVASGEVQVGSNTTINGYVEGGTINVGTPAIINGDVTATHRFALGSGGKVTGNIVAPEVELYASQSNITGNITASKLLTMGDSVKVKGTVDTGTLTMYAASAMIEGTAKVNFATLYWNGRVTQPIVCKAGTRPGYCDCVDNQSGNPVNTTNGPRCESAKPVTGTFSHFLIEHDGNDAATCSTKNVTVSACANDDCSQKLATSTRVIMQPGGASANFTGSGTVQVSSARKGVNKLSLTLDGAATQFKCRNTKNNSSSCDVNFTGDVGFQIKVPNHKAGNWVTAELQALKSNGTECKPAFVNVSKPVQYTCSHSEPTSDALPVMLARTTGTNPANPVELMCSANRLVLWDTAFDGNAKAQIGLTYTDAGKVTLNARTDEISGAATFTAAPDHFDIVTPSPLRAGLDFDVTLTARNASGATTPNFSKAGYPTTADATKTTVSMLCNPGNGAMQSVETEFSGGEAKILANFTEAGWINLQAELKNFLNSGVTTVSATGDNAATACTPKVGPFVPMYFQVELNDKGRIVVENGKDRAFYYSGEPIPLKVTAMNAKGQPTTNYPVGYGSDHAFTLSAVNAEGTPFAADFGKFAGALAASDFVAGVATWTPSTKSPQASFQFTKAGTEPTVIRLRANNKAATGALPAGHDITSAGDIVHEKAQPQIRSGRLRIASIFGYRGASLKLPVRAEYWSGKSWLLNERDSFSKIPATAMAQTRYAHAVAGGAGVLPKQQVFADLTMQKGESVLPVQSDTSGWVDIAFNLGIDTTQDQSCLKADPARTSTGAKLPWLQSLGGCTDPSGRATFGIFAPESKRIIHMREVFN